MSPTVRADSAEKRKRRKEKRKVPKMYKSHPAYVERVGEPLSVNAIWNEEPFLAHES